ncbi:MAG: low affinity iron permease family protein [Ilyomonas sp.]
MKPVKNNSPESSVAEDINLQKQFKLSKLFDSFSTKVTKGTGSPWAFIIALVVVIVWAITGPVFHFSDTWQLVINTGTTIVTFLMVFVIQQSQNKDTVALQLKLNELIASSRYASNRLIDVEDFTQDELEVLKSFYVRLSEKAAKENNLKATHSIEDAEENANAKNELPKKEKKEELPKKGNKA